MNNRTFEMVEPNVLKVLGAEKGPGETEYEGKTYYRFMDFFYTYTPFLDELSADEVNNLCRARAKFPDLISQTNIDVRKLFKQIAVELAPKTFLEIGAGSHPIFQSQPQNCTKYIISDADPEVIEKLRSFGNACQIFSSSECKLHFDDGHFELVMAVFVLHFPFYKNQLAELYRVMSPSGAMIANVYRRTMEAKNQLSSDIENAGFKIHKVHDYKKLCKDHEYWIVGKDLKFLHSCARTLNRIDTA
ncbi:class I SAM-dependent methyltransferase [Pseudomonas syringae]|uniref:class I SAM-dependent methyltransferase n=1 Tax=Pseudomonas syringae TaxID=317 RepID=UPI00200A90B0|nr:class I SAM-dependent methyltransferase [Pseudomonas syringae pv. syringae]